MILAVGAGAEPARLRVELGPKSYDIVVGEGLIEAAATHLTPVLTSRRVAVVADETVAELHLPALLSALGAGGIEVHEIIVPRGESTKDFAHLERLIEALLDAKIERDDAVVAFGGAMRVKPCFRAYGVSASRSRTGRAFRPTSCSAIRPFVPWPRPVRPRRASFWPSRAWGR